MDGAERGTRNKRKDDVFGDCWLKMKMSKNGRRENGREQQSKNGRSKNGRSNNEWERKWNEQKWKGKKRGKFYSYLVIFHVLCLCFCLWQDRGEKLKKKKKREKTPTHRIFTFIYPFRLSSPPRSRSQTCSRHCLIHGNVRRQSPSPHLSIELQTTPRLSDSVGRHDERRERYEVPRPWRGKASSIACLHACLNPYYIELLLRTSLLCYRGPQQRYPIRRLVRLTFPLKKPKAGILFSIPWVWWITPASKGQGHIQGGGFHILSPGCGDTHPLPLLPISESHISLDGHSYHGVPCSREQSGGFHILSPGCDLTNIPTTSLPTS